MLRAVLDWPTLVPRTQRITIVCLIAALATLSAAVSAQRFGRLAEGPGVPPRYPTATFADGAFTHCKLMYTSVVSEPNGMGWATDYPYAAVNLLTRISELTKTPISRDRDGNPNYWVVRATDEALFHCPFVMATDVGTLEFTPEEVARLRVYLLKGGFLWVDDFWGTAAWEQWSSQIARVLPEYPIFDVPPTHPLRRSFFQVTEIPQVTSINMWRRLGGETRERGSDSPQANLRAIADETGRIMVLMTHNTDMGDSWEREGEDHRFFLQFSPQGYAVGINVILYALTH